MKFADYSLGSRQRFPMHCMCMSSTYLWSFTLIGAYLGAVDQRYQVEFATTEASTVPRQNATLGADENALSTQLYDIFVLTSTGTARGKCHNAGVNEGFESWRQFVAEWVPSLRTRHVGILTQILAYRFDGDVATKMATC